MPGMTALPGPELTQIQTNLKAMLERMGPTKAQAHPSYLGATPTTPGAPGAPTTPTAATPAATPGAPTDPMAMYRQALEGLSGGGAMLESSLADIEAGKQQAIGAGQQALVSGGLAGTTIMGGVPIAAEATAGRARLAARGQVEQLRLQTLASYAGLAQQAKLASAERQAALKRLQAQISAQKTAATSAQKAEVKRLQTQIAAQRQATTLAEMREPTPATDRGGFAVGTGGGTAFAPGRLMMKPFDYSGFTNIVSGGAGGGPEPYSYGAHLTPNIPRTNVSGMGPTTAFPSRSEPSGRGGGYAQQFPSIYGEAEEPVPQWM